ncbi:hypothetical protein C0J52_20286 [Blattella germanica]|nr:hypothetical protein C0J52_20286 [Blattella germanica]
MNILYDDEVADNVDDNDDPVSEASETEDFVEEIEEVGDVLTYDGDDSSVNVNSPPQDDAGRPIYTSKSGMEWEATCTRSNRRQNQNILRNTSGLTISSRNVTTVSEAFMLFLDSDIMQTVVNYTNQKANYFYQSLNLSDTNNKRVWIPTNIQEMYAFVGVLLEPREICNKLPDPSKYQPRYFTTTALQQAKVDLTWDETNPEREELNKKLMSGQVDGISEADLRDYLATSSEDESGESGKEESENKHEATADDPVLKYRSLLQEIEESEEKRKKNDVEMEITWGVGLKEKTEKLVQKKLKEKQNDLTPFEKFLEKKKEKKIQKKEEKKKKAKQETGESDNMFSEDDIPSDVDMNDPYFKEEFQGNFNKKEKKIKQKKDADNSREELQQDQAELELLLMNDAEEKNHFSLKSILEQESEDKKKHRKKKKRKQTSTEEKTEDFKVNVKDERFSALYSSHHFNIDPTDPHYRKTKGMEALRAEKISYRQQNQTNLVHTKRRKTVSQHNQDPELSVLVKTVKRKAQNLQGTGR